MCNALFHRPWVRGARQRGRDRAAELGRDAVGVAQTTLIAHSSSENCQLMVPRDSFHHIWDRPVPKMEDEVANDQGGPYPAQPRVGSGFADTVERRAFDRRRAPLLPGRWSGSVLLL